MNFLISPVRKKQENDLGRKQQGFLLNSFRFGGGTPVPDPIPAGDFGFLTTGIPSAPANNAGNFDFHS